MEPEAAGLDRGTCPRFRFFRGRHPPDGQRQSQGRDHQGLLSRADGQPDPSLRWGRLYAEMARHYGTAIVPARPYKPRDKAKVEVGVQVVGRWILARLRHRRFFSLAELNVAIRALLDELNDRPMRSWGMSRRALFEQLDKPALTTAAGLRVCRVEALPRRPRLPRRDCQALLQRAAPAYPPGGRGAHHRRDNRDLLLRQTGRQPMPQPAPASADHCPRAHAQRSPALSRLDPRAHPP